jgi:hypothetical protein
MIQHGFVLPHPATAAANDRYAVPVTTLFTLLGTRPTMGGRRALPLGRRAFGQLATAERLGSSNWAPELARLLPNSLLGLLLLPNSFKS